MLIQDKNINFYALPKCNKLFKCQFDTVDEKLKLHGITTSGNIQ